MSEQAIAEAPPAPAKTKKTKTPKTVTPPAAEGAVPVKKGIGQIAADAAAQRKTIAQGDKFVFIRKPEKPVAPQAQTIIATIESHGEDGVSRPELVKELTTVLTTRQPAERILTYYQKTLVDGGAIKIVNPGRETPADATVEATA